MLYHSAITTKEDVFGGCIAIVARNDYQLEVLQSNSRPYNARETMVASLLDRYNAFVKFSK